MRTTAALLSAAAVSAAVLGAAASPGESTVLLSPAAVSAGVPGAAASPAKTGVRIPVAGAVLPLPAAGAARAPVVRQLVVLPDGRARSARVAAAAVTLRVGKRRCTVGARTPLAALVRSRVGALRLRDYGSCSRRPRDAAGLFVRAIAGKGSRGRNGWVHKVGARAASAGAADPSGPFGSGRLHSGARVTWLYCRMGDDGCQRTLAVTTTTEPGSVVARVSGYDDQGDGVPVEGATVHVGATTATTGPDGRARVATTGSVRVWAEKDGLVRSFTERLEVP